MNKYKAILIINLDGHFGGAEKRYISLFNHIVKKKNNYKLIINDALYDTSVNYGILNRNNNIFILKLIRNSKKKCESVQLNKRRKFRKNKPTVQYSLKSRYYLGQFKYLIKLAWLWVSFACQFIRLVKKYNINLVYSVWFGGIWTWPLKNVLGLTLIHSYNDSSLSSISKSLFKALSSEYWVLKHCDKIDFLSENIVPRLENQIGQIDKSRISISANSFINYRSYFPASSKENNVIFMARLVKIKNPLLFLKSIEIANTKYNMSAINYYILGAGPLENSVEDYICSYRLKNVFYKGEVSMPWEYLQKSRVFVSIQKDENYPSQSLLEAMACENAIIASDVGETRKLVTEDEGILVKLDAEEIANALDKLFSSPGLIEKLGGNARKKAIENHNIEKFTEYFYEITTRL